MNWLNNIIISITTGIASLLGMSHSSTINNINLSTSTQSTTQTTQSINTANQVNVPNNQPSVSAPSTDNTNSWQNYTNARYGFEFKYPANQGMVSQEEQIDNLGSAGTFIMNTSTKKAIFWAIGGKLTPTDNISDMLSAYKNGLPKLLSIQPGSAATVNQTTISGRPAVILRVCSNQGVCGQTISIPDFTIQSTQYGQTMHEVLTIQFQESDLTLKMLSTFKFN